MKPEEDAGHNSWLRARTAEAGKADNARKSVEEVETGTKTWLPVALTFVALCVLTWINEIAERGRPHAKRT